MQHPATPRNRCQRIVAPKGAGPWHWTAVSLYLSLVLTPLWYHRQRNTVQHLANPCNAWIITRGWSRCAVRVRSSPLPKWFI